MGLDMLVKKINRKVNKDKLQELTSGEYCYIDKNHLQCILRDVKDSINDCVGQEFSKLFSVLYYAPKTEETLKRKLKEQGYSLTKYKYGKLSDEDYKSMREYTVKNVKHYLNLAKEEIEEKLKLVEGNVFEREEIIVQEIGYFRKHSDLHGLMEDLYYENGGSGDFNCKKLILDEDKLELIIEKHGEGLDKAGGFFWGESTEEDCKDSLEFFEKVLKETNFEKETVYYSAWY